MITTAGRHGRSWGSAALVGLLLIVVTPLAPAAAEDTLIHVPGGAGTIQAAIDLAPAGAIVLVAPGTYRENLLFKGKAVEVRSVTGPATTIIDGGGVGPVVAFYGRETRASVLRGFTIRNGRNGIDAPNASPTIVGNIITGNQAWDGGGIRIDTTTALIQGNVIRGNTASMGGGLYVAHATGAEIVGNTIEANTSSGQGGGIQFAWSGEPMVRNNLIRGNRAGTGGGFSTTNAPTRPMVLNNVFVGNEASEGGAAAFQPVLGTFGGTLANNTLVANQAPRGSAIVGWGDFLVVNNVISGPSNAPAVHCSGWTGGRYFFNDVYNGTPNPVRWCTNFLGLVGNVSVDPKLRSDFGLHAGSPAIDAGEDGVVPEVVQPPTDANGLPRIVDGNADGVAKPDMGAFEWPGPGLAPQSAVAPTSLDFGTVRYGERATASITVTSAGPATLHVATATVSGDPDIRVAANACIGAPIGLGELCTITIEFTVATGGPKHASITIASDAGTTIVSATGVGDASSLRYLDRAYRDLLGRPPVRAEIDAWATKVGTMSGRWDFTRAAVAGAEYRVRAIDADARAYLGHPAEPVLAGALVDAMAAGAPLELSAVIFLGSDEFYARHGRNPERFMDALFRQVLGRPPATGELTAWGNLIRGGYDRSITALTFLLQPDARARLIDAAYQRWLGRPPDAASTTAWVSLLGKGLPSEHLPAWLASTEEYWSHATA